MTAKIITFDASIHLGQFIITNEQIRLACKNSQTDIAAKGHDGIIGLCTFNENSWVDHVIWDLTREQQDAFYPFMDIFHSVKNIIRVPLTDSLNSVALQIQKGTNLPIANALTCAAAVLSNSDTIHTLYTNLLNVAVQKYLRDKHYITITTPPLGTEQKFTEKNLENNYQNALTLFRAKKINLLKKELSDKVKI